MKMSLFVSLCCSVVFYSYAGQAACVQPPSCDELGFTVDASKCEGAALKCPWDTDKAACNENKITTPTELPVLYGDGTVAKGIIDGKTPIGIVFDETNKLAMALTNIWAELTYLNKKIRSSLTFYWFSMPCDVKDLENCSPQNEKNCATDGKTNTKAILSSTCDLSSSAVSACNDYEAEGCTKDFCTKTNWFIPSVKELSNIYTAQNNIQITLNSLNAHGFFVHNILGTSENTMSYWSSTEFDSNQQYVFYLSSGGSSLSTKTEGLNYVRPVIQYQ